MTDHLVPGALVKMVSIRPERLPNVLGDFRYRVYVWSPYEKGSFLGIDKVTVKGNRFDKSHWYREVRPSDSLTLKPIIKKLSFENAIGCCEIKNIKWVKLNIIFETIINKKKYDCLIANGTKKKSPLVCTET